MNKRKMLYYGRIVVSEGIDALELKKLFYLKQ